MVKTKESGDMLAVSGSDMALFEGSDMALFEGSETALWRKPHKLCPLTVENSRVIRNLFDYTNPVSHEGRNITIGLGDRLGLASPAHIQLLRDLDIFPVLAQQSIRELTLTARTFDDVLAAAAWAVFREGYTKGYGADGDHLKTHEEVKTALDCGYTMITLDCSAHIGTDPDALLSGAAYTGAIEHTANIFNTVISKCPRYVDFELSIDETPCATSPTAHLFIAGELKKRGVRVTSVAPRFCGEFQKGIDYKGDLRQFEREFAEHTDIAGRFGYKISIHSGSDKFSVFPIISKLTGGKYHLKTAGTNWLEAVRTIAAHEPQLYREIHTFALKNLSEAKKYYHTTENIANIADISGVTDAELPLYLEQEDARQVLHITYGLILEAKAPNGSPLFRDRIYQVLALHESEHFAMLKKHIGRHLTALGIL
jgi:hypothetical protein